MYVEADIDAVKRRFADLKEKGKEFDNHSRASDVEAILQDISKELEALEKDAHQRKVEFHLMISFYQFLSFF